MAQSIFTTQTPVLADENDAGANQDLGTVWTTNADGQVTGIRWRFPNTLPSGTVTGLLWTMDSDSTGTELARADFVSPTAGAWNMATFTSPVSVTAGSYYCASIHSPDRYVATLDFFDGASVTNGNLTAIAHLAPFSNGRFNFDSAVAVFPNNASSRRVCYFADVVFDVPGAQSVAPTGLAVPVALGSPTLAWSASVAPDGIAVPVALGSPTVGSASIAPVGVSVPVALGSPTLTWTGAIAPDGVGVPVALGTPSATIGGITPAGIGVPVALGAPSLTWSGAVSPDGITVPVGLGVPAVSQPGQSIVRPNTGTTTRPDTGRITRPNTGTVTRP